MYNIEALQWKDYSQWVEHCGGVFDDTGAAYFHRHFKNDPNRDLDSIFVIKQDGVIVSTVRVFHRQIYLGGHSFKMGGIGEVSTKADYRGKGLSYAILNRCMEYMRHNGFALSMLGTGYFGHYQKHGYQQTKMPRKAVEGGAAQPDGEIRPLEFSADISDAYALYKKYARQHNGPIARTFDYFITWSTTEMASPHGLFRDGRMVGYICFRGSKCTELCCEPGDTDALLGMIPPNENGGINVPAFAPTSRRVISEWDEKDLMVNVITPFDLGGTKIDTTQKLLDYLENNGGIVYFESDGF